MDNDKTKSIIQALESAEQSLVLAKKLLGGSGLIDSGVIGEFDGESVVTKEGRRHQVPPNYASKSRLVVGDTLRIIGSGEGTVFKQIKKIERIKTSGILTKKDGKWTVVTEQGSFLVLPVSVDYFKGKFGDEVEVIIPKDYKNLKPKWAVLEQVMHEVHEVKVAEVTKETKVVLESKPPKLSNKPKNPENSKSQTVKENPTIALRPAVGGTSAGQVAEVQKKTPLKQPKVRGEPPEPPKAVSAVRGEIKVEEELR